MASLQIISGPNEGARFVLTEPTVTVGRVAGNVVCLADTTVSRHHAVFVQTGADYELRDLNSTNGTYVNEQRITQSLLKSDVPLRFGAIKVLYVATKPVPAPAPIPVTPPPPPPAPVAPSPPQPTVAARSKPELSIGSLMKKRVEFGAAETPAGKAPEKPVAPS